MDDKFMDTLKTFTVKDIIEDVQRPPTSINRLKTATARRPMIRSTPLEPLVETINSGQAGIESLTRPGTSMVSSKAPPSAFAGNRGGSWRTDSAAPSRDFKRPGTTRPTSSRQPLFSTPRTLEDDSDLNIPDLADVAEEEFTQTVASAPEFEVQRLTSLRELDAELAKNKSFCIVDGVDLRKLARRMVPERKLVEMEDIWTYNSLYSELGGRFEEQRARSTEGRQNLSKLSK